MLGRTGSFRVRSDKRALHLTRDSLRNLCDRSRIPDVPDTPRAEARRLFEYYPESELIDIAAAIVPLQFTRVDDGGDEPVHAVNYLDVVVKLASQ